MTTPAESARLLDRTADQRERDEPRISVEMGGANVVIRATSDIDHACTVALADAVNAALDANECVVLDPDPIRCDDVFAASTLRETDDRPTSGARPHLSVRERPLASVDVVSSGIVRLRGSHQVWLIDVATGRLCRSERDVDVRFLDDSAWERIIAVAITPTRLLAQTTKKTQLSTPR